VIQAPHIEFLSVKVRLVGRQKTQQQPRPDRRQDLWTREATWT
jgi:hypothetical protein